MRDLLVFLLVVTGAGPAVAQEWEQFLDQDGVKGYARSVAGSRILELRSTVVIPARIEVVGAVLRDVEGLARPGSNCTEGRFIEKPDRNHYTFYAAYDLPWPVADRDVVIQVSNRYDLERGRVVATLKAVTHPRVPRRKGFLRITDLSAEFVVQYISREKTGVVYTSRTDPGGSIPTWLINRVNQRSLRSSAKDLREAVKKPEYVLAAAGSPDAALVARLTSDPRLRTRVLGNRLRELIRDQDFVATLLADRQLAGWLLKGDEAGEILLHSWGSRRSRHQAVTLLLRRLLARIRDPAAVERFVSNPQLCDRILRGQGGDAEVKAFVGRFQPKGQQGTR